jgi:Co/Zn/Cd efflux system component
VVADALTSVLAILALVAGHAFGWSRLDPVVGVLGAILIARWAASLAARSGAVLLDAGSCDLAAVIRERMESGADRLVDLHVWRVGPGHHAAIISLVSERPEAPAAYKGRLADIPALCHVTVEVHPREAIAAAAR